MDFALGHLGPKLFYYSRKRINEELADGKRVAFNDNNQQIQYIKPIPFSLFYEELATM